MEVPSPVRDVKIVSPISTFVQNKSTLEQSASSSLLLLLFIIIIIIIIIIIHVCWITTTLVSH